MLLLLVIIQGCTGKVLNSCYSTGRFTGSYIKSDYHTLSSHLVLFNGQKVMFLSDSESIVSVDSVSYCTLLKSIGEPESCNPYLRSITEAYKGELIQPLNVYSDANGIFINFKLNFARYNFSDTTIPKGDTAVDVYSYHVLTSVKSGEAFSEPLIISEGFVEPLVPHKLVAVLPGNKVLYKTNMTYPAMERLSETDSSNSDRIKVVQFAILEPDDSNVLHVSKYIQLPLHKFLITSGNFLISSDFELTLHEDILYVTHKLIPTTYTYDISNGEFVVKEYGERFPNFQKSVLGSFNFTVPDSLIQYSYFVHDTEYVGGSLILLLSYDHQQFIYSLETDELSRLNLKDIKEDYEVARDNLFICGSGTGIIEYYLNDRRTICIKKYRTLLYK